MGVPIVFHIEGEIRKSCRLWNYKVVREISSFCKRTEHVVVLLSPFQKEGIRIVRENGFLTIYIKTVPTIFDKINDRLFIILNTIRLFLVLKHFVKKKKHTYAYIFYSNRTNLRNWFLPGILGFLSEYFYNTKEFNYFFIYKHAALFWFDRLPRYFRKTKLYFLRRIFSYILAFFEYILFRYIDGILSVSPFDETYVEKLFKKKFLFLPVPINVEELIKYRDMEHLPKLSEFLPPDVVNIIENGRKEGRLVILHYSEDLYTKGTADFLKIITRDKELRKRVLVILLANKIIRNIRTRSVISLPRLKKLELLSLFQAVDTMFIGGPHNIRGGIGIVLIEFMFVRGNKVISTTLPILGREYHKFGFFFKDLSECKKLLWIIIRNRRLLKIKNYEELINFFKEFCSPSSISKKLENFLLEIFCEAK